MQYFERAIATCPLPVLRTNINIMRPTTLLRATHVRQPMIHFLGKRSNIEKGEDCGSLRVLPSLTSHLPLAPHAPKPHPQAPKDIAENFQSFLSKLQSSSHGASSPSSNPKNQSLSSSAAGKVESSSSSGKKAAPVDFEVFYEAPSRLWKTKPLEEFEIEAIMVSCESAARAKHALIRVWVIRAEALPMRRHKAAFCVQCRLRYVEEFSYYAKLGREEDRGIKRGDALNHKALLSACRFPVTLP